MAAEIKVCINIKYSQDLETVKTVAIGQTLIGEKAQRKHKDLSFNLEIKPRDRIDQTADDSNSVI